VDDQQAPVKRAFSARSRASSPVGPDSRVSHNSWIGSLKELLEKAFGLAQAFLGEYHGFRLVDRIVDKPACMQPAEDIPVEALPGAVVVVDKVA